MLIPNKDSVARLKRMLLPLTVTTGLALFIGLFFGIYARPHIPDALHVFCDANGNVNLFYNSNWLRYHSNNIYWDASYFLGITLGFGRFSFATARVIDGLWDICVARGGQGVLAILVYPVLRRSFNTHTRKSLAGLPLFTSLAFDKISFTLAYNALRDALSMRKPNGEPGSSGLTGVGSTKSKIWRYTGWLLLLLYILAFPTLTSIISGYQPRYLPYLNPPDSNSLIPMSPFTIPHLQLRSWDDVGFSGPVVFDFDSEPFRNLSLYYNTCVVPAQQYFEEPPEGYPKTVHCPDAACTCTIDIAEQQMLKSYTMLNITNTDITINNHNWSLHGPLYFGLQCGAGDGDNVCIDDGRVFLTDGTYTLSRNYLQDHGFCRPTNEYMWGFSSLALLTHLLISLVTAAIATALHFDALRNEHRDARGFDGNLYSDVVTVYEKLEGLKLECPLKEISPSELQHLVHRRHVRVDGNDQSMWQSKSRMTHTVESEERLQSQHGRLTEHLPHYSREQDRKLLA